MSIGIAIVAGSNTGSSRSVKGILTANEGSSLALSYPGGGSNNVIGSKGVGTTMGIGMGSGIVAFDDEVAFVEFVCIVKLSCANTALLFVVHTGAKNMIAENRAYITMIPCRFLDMHMKQLQD
jgi:hypothetical protein